MQRNATSPKILSTKGSPIRSKKPEASLSRVTSVAPRKTSSSSPTLLLWFCVFVGISTALPYYFMLKQQSRQLDIMSALEEQLDQMHAWSPASKPATKATRTSLATAEANSPYAYAFVLGGIDPDQPGYRGFYYNVLISTRALQRYGSSADVWLFVQMASDTDATTLTEQEHLWADAVGLRIHYVPKPCVSSFADLVFEKFRILEMTQYQRVLLLDGDILPLANMDYMFQLSSRDRQKDEQDPFLTKTWYPATKTTVYEPTWLQPNVIYATRHEPCNAGMFVLAPAKGAHAALLQVIADQHEAAKDLPYPKFDKFAGWGHDFYAHGDQWDAILSSGRRWNFNAGHSDQGLLYHWGKYVQRSVSIIIGDRVEHWVPDTNNTENKSGVRLEAIQYLALENYTSPTPYAIQNSCNRRPDNWNCRTPYRDMAHFFGSTKPWEDAAKKWRKSQGGNETHGRNQAYRLWYELLEEVDRDLDMGLEAVADWPDDAGGPPLGRLATYKDHAQRVHEKTNDTQC